MRARSGPAPITSTRDPGKRSSASTSVLMPLSTTRGPTNSPPERRLFMRRPATRLVLDLRDPLRLLGLRRDLGLVDLDLDPARARLLGFNFLFAAASAEAARGIEVSSGGCGGTHRVRFSFSQAGIQADRFSSNFQ